MTHASDRESSNIRAAQRRLAELRQSSADLLELVRSAEEGAVVAAGESPPRGDEDTALTSEPEAPRSQEFVDVGDEAVDAPPSFAPGRSSSSPRERVSASPMEVGGERLRAASGGAAAALVLEPARALSPMLGIALALALAIVALYAVTR